MSECPSFHCSRCRISHADECPPTAAPAPVVAINDGFHDWEKMPVYDLSLRSVCKKCLRTHCQTLINTVLGTPNPPPVDGCPGKPPN